LWRSTYFLCSTGMLVQQSIDTVVVLEPLIPRDASSAGFFIDSIYLHWLLLVWSWVSCTWFGTVSPSFWKQSDSKELLFVEIRPVFFAH